MTSFREKIICVWKKLYEKKGTSFADNPDVKCATCDGYRAKECKQYLNKSYIENKKQQAKGIR